MTISRQFFETAMRAPNKVAVIQGTLQLTYAELLKCVQWQAHVLRVNGIKRHDHIMVQLSGIDFVVMLLAAADSGICIVPLGADAAQDTIGKAYAATECKFLINEGAAVSDTDSFSVRLKFQGKPDDRLLIITTSGSTGEPKPILLKQKTKLARIKMMNDLYHCTENDVTLISTPLHHSMGQRVVLMSLLKGGTLVLMDGWSAEKWWQLAEQNLVTFAVPVASQVKQIAASALTKQTALRCVVSSSALLDVEQTLAMPCPVYNCYGTTEVSIVTSTDSTTPLGSVGKPICGAAVGIADDGEILIETPLLFDGYYNQPELTESAVWCGLFRTGDLGRLDAEGNLYYLGRIKELINVGGTKVYLQDVEAVMAQHLGTAECAAFPMHDDALGEVVALAIVPENYAAPELKYVQQFCLPYLTDAQLPRAVFAVDALPKTETGKVQRGKLAEMFGGVK